MAKYLYIPQDEWAQVIDNHMKSRSADAYETREWKWWVHSPLEKCENCGLPNCIFVEDRFGNQFLYRVTALRIDENISAGEVSHLQTKGRYHVCVHKPSSAVFF